MGAIITFESGYYITGKYELKKSVILKGAKAGIDARNRSNIGQWNNSYDGCGDKNETTIFGFLPLVLIITGNDIVIDGFTFT